MAAGNGEPLSSRELFQPLTTGDMLATSNGTGCQHVHRIYQERTSSLGERISSIVTLIDRMNAALHKLIAENRDSRAGYALSQSKRHGSPFAK